jgi:phage-related protein
VTGDVRNFAKQTERDLNRALDGVDLDPVEVPVDREALRKAGEQAGEDLGEGVTRGADGKLRNSKGQFVKMGEDAGGNIGDGVTRGVDGKLRDLSGRFVEEGVKAGKSGGESAGKAFGDGTDKSLKKQKSKIEKSITGTLVDSLKSATKPMGDALSTVFGALSSLAKPALIVAGVAIAGSLAAVIAPALAAALSGALIAGGGLGIIGLGVMLLKSKPELVKAAQSLMSSVKKEFTKAALPLLKPLVTALGTLGKVAERIAPQLHGIFANLAPAIVPFALGLGQLVEHLLPGLNQLTAAAAPLLVAIAHVLPAVGTGFSNFFSSIAGSGPAATTFMTDFLKGTAAAISGLGTGLGWLANQYPKVRDTLIAGFSAIGKGVVTFWKAFSGDGPAAMQIFRDFGAVAGAAIGVIGKAFGWLIGRYPAVRNGAVNAFNDIKSAITDTVNYVKANQNWLGPLISGITGAAAAFVVLKGAVTLYTTVTKIATAIQIAFDAAMAANPIGLVVIAIGALVGALIWFFTQTKIGREIWATTWAAIKAAAQAVADWFMGTVVPALAAAWNVIKTVAQAVASWFTGTLVPALSGAWANIQAAAAAVAGWFMTYVAPVFSALGGLIAAIFARVQQAGSFLWSSLQPIFTLIGNAWTVLWNVISAVWNAIGPVIFAEIRGAVSVLVAIWSAGWNVLKAVVMTVFNVVKTIVETALTALAGIIRAVTDIINGNWSAAWSEIKGVVSTLINGAKAVVSAAMNGILSIIRSVMSGVRSVWSAAWNALKGVVSAAVGGIRSAANSIKSAVLGVFSSAGSWLLSAGRKIIDGLISGISAGFGRVKSLLGSLTSLLPDWKGPAQVDEKILYNAGQLTMKGYEAGLEDRFSSVRKKLGGLTGDLPAMAVRGGDGASAANPSGGNTTLTIMPGAIVIQGGGAGAGEEAAEAILQHLADAVTVR